MDKLELPVDVHAHVRIGTLDEVQRSGLFLLMCTVVDGCILKIRSIICIAEGARWKIYSAVCRRPFISSVFEKDALGAFGVPESLQKYAPTESDRDDLQTVGVSDICGGGLAWQIGYCSLFVCCIFSSFLSAATSSVSTSSVSTSASPSVHKLIYLHAL